MEKPLILIVDDDEMFTWINKKVLRSTSEDIEVDICSNGKQALRYLELNAGSPEFLPDIILLDINMPVMDGWEFLEDYEKIVRNLKRQPKIWVLSSSIVPEEIERANKHSLVAGYISKPFLKEDSEMIARNAFLSRSKRITKAG